MIDMSKTYRTRDGRQVRLLMTDGGGQWPVIGAVNTSGQWLPTTWTPDGEFGKDTPSGADLVEVKPMITKKFWLGYWATGEMSVHYSKPATHPAFIAIPGPFSVTFSEGDGLNEAALKPKPPMKLLFTPDDLSRKIAATSENASYEAGVLHPDAPSDTAKLAALEAELRRVRAVMHEVDGCFEAALVEGWNDALANGDIEVIRDLYNRRIAYARLAVISQIADCPAKPEEKQHG